MCIFYSDPSNEEIQCRNCRNYDENDRDGYYDMCLCTRYDRYVHPENDSYCDERCFDPR